MSFKVSWKIHILCLVISWGICFIIRDFINELFLGLFLENEFLNMTGNITIDLALFLLIIFIPIALIHELLHGSTYKLFGGKVKYGFKGIYAYAQETSGIVLHRTKFLIVLLIPVTTISVVSLLLPGTIGAIVYLLNLLGSTGDLLMAFYLCKSNVNSYIVDRNYGFDVIHKVVTEQINL